MSSRGLRRLRYSTICHAGGRHGNWDGANDGDNDDTGLGDTGPVQQHRVVAAALERGQPLGAQLTYDPRVVLDEMTVLDGETPLPTGCIAASWRHPRYAVGVTPARQP